MNRYLFLRLLLNVFELLAFSAGLLHWKKIKGNTWKWFTVYLGVIAFTEILNEWIGYRLDAGQVNKEINFFFSIPLQFFFYCWLFYKYFQTKGERRWPLAGAVIYFLALLAELLFLKEKRWWFLSFSYTTGNIILLVLALRFFYQFMTSDAILYYKTNMLFWVCLGLLFFYLGSLPFFGLWNTLATQYPQLFNQYWILQMGLNCLMYLFFSIAFVWGKPN